MSTAYRDGSRAELPEPFLERNTWPHQLVQYLPEEQRAEIKAQGLVCPLTRLHHVVLDTICP